MFNRIVNFIRKVHAVRHCRAVINARFKDCEACLSPEVVDPDTCVDQCLGAEHFYA